MRLPIISIAGFILVFLTGDVLASPKSILNPNKASSESISTDLPSTFVKSDQIEKLTNLSPQTPSKVEEEPKRPSRVKIRRKFKPKVPSDVASSIKTESSSDNEPKKPTRIKIRGKFKPKVPSDVASSIKTESSSDNEPKKPTRIKIRGKFKPKIPSDVASSIKTESSSSGSKINSNESNKTASNWEWNGSDWRLSDTSEINDNLIPKFVGPKPSVPPLSYEPEEMEVRPKVEINYPDIEIKPRQAVPTIQPQSEEMEIRSKVEIKNLAKEVKPRKTAPAIQLQPEEMEIRSKVEIKNLAKEVKPRKTAPAIQPQPEEMEVRPKVEVKKLAKEVKPKKPVQGIQPQPEEMEVRPKVEINYPEIEVKAKQAIPTIQLQQEEMEVRSKVEINYPEIEVKIRQAVPTIQPQTEEMEIRSKVEIKNLAKEIKPRKTVLAIHPQSEEMDIRPKIEIKNLAKEVKPRKTVLAIQPQPEEMEVRPKVEVKKLAKEVKPRKTVLAIQPQPEEMEVRPKVEVKKLAKEVKPKKPVQGIQPEPEEMDIRPKIEIKNLAKEVKAKQAIPAIQPQPEEMDIRPKVELITITQTKPHTNLEENKISGGGGGNKPPKHSSIKQPLALSTANDDVLLSLKSINDISSLILHDSLNLISQTFTLRLNNLTKFGINTLVAAGENDPAKKGLWIKGLRSFSKQNPKEDDLGYKNHHQGIVIGIDTELKKEVLTAGIAYTNTFSKTKFRGISVTNDNVQRTNLHVITLYGQYVLSPKVLINANLNYGKAFIKTQRNNQNVLYLGKTKGDLFRAGGEASYKADYDKIFSLLPKVGITFDKFSINSFEETSSNLNFKVGRKSSARVAANIGAKIIKYIKMREFEVAPGINLNLEQTVFSKSNRNTITTINNEPQTVVSEVVKPSRATYTLGAFLNARKTKSIELNLGYDYTFRRRYYNHSAYASLNFNF